MRLFPMLLIIALLAAIAVAQDTQPASDLVRENQRLKDRVAQLEARVKELESKLKATQPRIVPSPQLPFQYPSVPGYKVPAPSTRQYTWPPVVPPVTPDNAPRDWQRYRFNGQDVYVIPLNDRRN